MDSSPTPFVNFDFTTIDLRVVFAFLAIIVAIALAFYFQWWRNRKRLSYDILSNFLLISAEEEIQDKVEIRYEGQPVKNVHLVIIKVINDGYIPIKKDDFEQPVRINFPKAKILTAETVKLNPDNLATDIHYEDDWLEIKPALFNRKDYIQVKFLLTEMTGMRINARIVGVSKIGKVKETRDYLANTFFLLMMASQFGWLIVISFKYTGFYFSLFIMGLSILFLLALVRYFFRRV